MSETDAGETWMASVTRRWMPGPIVRDIRHVEHAGRLYWLDVTVTAELIGEEPGGGPLPARTDWGRRIAEMIKADLENAVL